MSNDLPVDERVGTTIGPYRIDAVLGHGGMGRVYRATSADGVEVALKIVKADLASDQIFRRRFDREARIARDVRHPHVVPLLDVGEHEGIPFLAEQLIGGRALERQLRDEGTVALAETVRICLEVASGLDALHAAGIIHRDVKPGNILIDPHGKAWITDFGLAKDTQGSVLTRPGQALGSLDYMAPEQIRAEQVSAATDVYALGCVMCECLTGSPPFADRRGMHVLWAHLQDDPPDPCGGRSDVPREVGATILRALEKNAARRPQSAGEFARLLEAAAASASPS
jgi:serine/threonine-protein kinase